MTTWVLLRGLTRERAHWGEFPSRLASASGERVVACDLPGAGSLHRGRCPWRVDRMVDACRRQATEQGAVPPLLLLGLSLGGMVSIAWAAAHPDELAGCIVVNTSARGLGAAWRRLSVGHWPALLRLLRATDPHRGAQAILRMTSTAPERHAAVIATWADIARARPVTPANALRQLAAAASYRLPSAPPRLPALVVRSALDGLVDPRCSAELASWWPAPLATHASAGHDLPLDDPAWLCETAVAWARRRSTGRSR